MRLCPIHPAFQKMEGWRKDSTQVVPDELWECLQSYFHSLNWDNYLKSLDEEALPFTFVHGDFHPGNIMWIPNDPHCRVRFFDWEMVGLDYGPQELGQYVVSHMDMSKYGAEVHEQLVRAYYDEMVATNPDVSIACSWEACFANFVNGGMRKWLWMLPLISVWNMDISNYFIHQIDSFRKMHGVRSDEVCYPQI